MRWTWILIIISIPFVMGITIMFSTWWYTNLMLWICKKSYSSHHFIIIKVHPWNVSNMDSHNYLHFFCTWALQLYSTNSDTWYWCFGFAWKAFHSTIFLISKFTREMYQTRILTIISTLFVTGTTIMISTLGYTILVLWVCKKSFSFNHFTYN